MIYTLTQLETLIALLKQRGGNFESSQCSLEFRRKPKEKKPLGYCCVCMGDEIEGLLQLESCCHSVHHECAKAQLNSGWTGKRISFGYMSCGECRVPMFHRRLKGELAPHLELKREVEMISCLKCAEDNIFQGLKANARRNDSIAKALCVNTISCFICNSCKVPFCAGRVNCADDSDVDVTTLNCASCAYELQREAQMQHKGDWRGKCRTHGYKFAIYKCDSCCSIATFDCRSNHYCARCHESAYDIKDYPCPGADKCPLGVEHPPNVSAIHGESSGEFIAGFVVGCSRCFSQIDDAAIDGFIADAQWQDRF